MFVKLPNGSLVRMVEQGYDAEAALQTLIADHPDLLAGDQIDPGEPRRWLLVDKEVGVPAVEGGGGYWSLDHLFLDQDGVPTLIEVKRSTDTRIRREVVGQMLDYAAHAVSFLPADRIRSLFEARCEPLGAAPGDLIANLTGDQDEESFWTQVATNLATGRIRLLFVADTIPIELRRVIEFWNRHTVPVEVLGVEIRQFVGEDLVTLVPQVFGQTVDATEKKARRGRPREWDEQSFFAALKPHGEQAVAVARRILDWGLSRGLDITYGRGAVHGTMMPLLALGEERHPTFNVYTRARVEVPFETMSKARPFADIERRRELLDRLNRTGAELPEDGLSRWPSIPFDLVAESMDEFLAVWDWYLDEVRH